MVPDPLETAKQALQQYYPDALGAFVGGSVMAGRGTATSDIDIAVLYDDRFEDVHRFSTTVNGWPVEFFVHSFKAQNYYFDMDRKRGMCVMPTLVSTGVIIPKPLEALEKQQEKARQIIENGPPPLTDVELEQRRYMLGDLLDDYTDASSAGQSNAILAQLHNLSGDLCLRGQGLWSGLGKALIRVMAEYDPEYAKNFQQVFEDAFAGGEKVPLVDFVEMILEPYGGRLRDGYRAAAPDSWKRFEE